MRICFSYKLLSVISLDKGVFDVNVKVGVAKLVTLFSMNRTEKTEFVPSGQQCSMCPVLKLACDVCILGMFGI